MHDKTTLNLIHDPWLRIRRRSGRIESIQPWRITEDIRSDPVVACAWPRPDLNGAAVELLIGMLSTAGAAASEDEWSWGWIQPPGPEKLETTLGPMAPHFELVADGPAFLQDLDPLEDARITGPARLLFDTPARDTERRNTDLFRKRVPDDAVLSLPAAAIALYALMSWCPSGGKGYRVALRGGGPLVTLPVLAHRELGDTLWGRVWPSVHHPGAKSLEKKDRAFRTARRGQPDPPDHPAEPFPWLEPTRTSNPGDEHEVVRPGDMHPLHAHWGMPRRVRLLTGPGAGRACAVTGERPANAVVAMRVRNYGMNYASGYPHPHAAGYRTKKDAGPLPVLTTARSGACGRIAGLVRPSSDGLRTPAPAVRRFRERAANPQAVRPRLLCFGIDADQAKIRAWIERTVPLPRAGEWVGELAVDDCMHPLAEAVTTAAGWLNGALKKAAPAVAGETAAVRLNAAVEPAFHQAWTEAAEAEAAGSRPKDLTWQVRARFAGTLQTATLALFDELAPAAGVEHRNPWNRAEARHLLVLHLSGRTKRGRKLYADTLRIRVPADTAPEPESARMPKPPATGDTSLPAAAWHWRAELDTSAGAADLARLNHAHTIEQALRTEAAANLAKKLKEYTDPATAALIAVALAMTRDDSAFSAARAAGRRRASESPALPETAFRALLQAPLNGRLTPLRRLLAAIPGRRANRQELAADLAAWTPDVRLRWTTDYCGHRTEPDPAGAQTLDSTAR